MKYLKYRCESHPKANIAPGKVYGLCCTKCKKQIFTRWCTKCKATAGWGNHEHCPKCDSPPKDHELRNHSLMWHDGDVYCLKCETRVRSWDAG